MVERVNGMHLKWFYPPEDKESAEEEPIPPAEEEPTPPAEEEPTPHADEEPPTPPVGAEEDIHFQTPRYDGEHNFIIGK